MSNLHVNLDEANKHTPKGFDLVGNNTYPTKDENGLSTYEERMSLPKAINFVDGTLAAPSTADGDVFVLTGSGTIHPDWGSATFDDWVRFKNSTAVKISPLAGYLCFDVTANEWKEYDGADWVTFGGGGGAVDTLYSADGTISNARIVDVNSLLLSYVNSSILNKGTNQLGGTTNFELQDSTSATLLKVQNDGSTTINGTLNVNTGILDNSLKLETTSTSALTNIAFYNSGAIDGYVGTFGSTALPVEAREKLVFASFGSGQLSVDTSSTEFRWNFGNFPSTNTDMLLTPTGLAIGTNFIPTAQLHVKGTTLLQGNTDIDGTLEVNTGTNFNSLKLETTATSQYTNIAFYNSGSIDGYVGTFGSTALPVEAREKLVFASFGTGQLSVDTSSTEFRWNFGNFPSTNTDMLLTPTGLGIGTNVTPTAQLHVVGSTLLNGNLGVFGATPIAQPTTAIIAPSPVAVGGVNVQTNDTFEGYTMSQVVKALRNLGILA